MNGWQEMLYAGVERPAMGEWRKRAACIGLDPEIFYPEPSFPPDEARKVCASCPVSAECLDYALTSNERFGVWAGTTRRQRREMRLLREAS